MANNKRRRIGDDNAYATISDTVATSNPLSVFGGQRGFNAHMQTVRLWAEPRADCKTTGTTNSHTPHRSVEEIRRAQYFHNIRSDSDVEGQILRILLAYFRDDIKISFRIHQHLWPLDLLIERLMKLDAWPTQHDLLCIASYCRILFAKRGVYDLNRIHKQTYFAWFIAEVEKITRWLSAGKTRGDVYARWHNKVLLVCLCFLLSETETSSLWDEYKDNLLYEVIAALERSTIVQQPFPTITTSLLDTFPAEVIRRLSLFFDFTSLQCFSSASSACRAVSKSVPENKAKWRRNLYFARNDAPLPRNCWNWKSLCLADSPCSRDVPSMSEYIFCSSDCVVQQGGIINIRHEGQTSKSLFNKMHLHIEQLGLHNGWTPHLCFYRPPHTVERMAFWGRNPFTKSNLLVPFEGYVSRVDRFILVFVGWDKHGGFIGTGVAESHTPSYFDTATDGSGRVSDVTLCIRYLPESDIRLTWSTAHLLSMLRRQYEMKILSEEEYPWKSSLFDLDYSIPVSVEFLDKNIMALNVRPKDSIGSIKMRILSNLRFKESESTIFADGFRLFHDERALDEVDACVSEYNADENFEEKLEPGALLRLEPPVLSDLSLADVVAIKPSPEVFSCSPLPHFSSRLKVRFNFVRGAWGSARIFHDLLASPFLSDIVMKRQCL